MKFPSDINSNPANINNEIVKPVTKDAILCSHCKRTATNGIKCKGICVADNDY